MGKLYVNIGAGYYLFKKTWKYDKTAFFQRIGLQYQVTDRLFASFGINAYDFHVANYLEWKLGYTFSKKLKIEFNISNGSNKVFLSNLKA
jgi:5-hydroxyisourate hydrolase-like protein (transthyretin family)